MTLTKIGVHGILHRGSPPKEVFAFFLLWNHTHNFDETWSQPSSPMMYQSLFMAWKKKMHRYLLSSPLHILWVIHAYQWFPGYLIQLLPVERPGILLHYTTCTNSFSFAASNQNVSHIHPMRHHVPPWGSIDPRFRTADLYGMRTEKWIHKCLHATSGQVTLGLFWTLYY